MNSRIKVLKQLVQDGHYVVDEPAIADAMLLRSIALRTLPDVSFRSGAARSPQIRSFRRHPAARSFRLSRREQRRLPAARPAELEPTA